MPGFEFTPDGIVQIGEQDNPGAREVNPAAVNAAPKPQAPPKPAEPKQNLPVARAPAATTQITGNRELIKAARARLKELKQELKRLAAVRREHDELQRLLKAAKEKPRSNVRSIRSAS